MLRRIYNYNAQKAERDFILSNIVISLSYIQHILTNTFYIPWQILWFRINKSKN